METSPASALIIATALVADTARQFVEAVDLGNLDEAATMLDRLRADIELMATHEL